MHRGDRRFRRIRSPAVAQPSRKIDATMTDLERWTMLLHLGSTLAMTGLIWFVQRVHYPLMSDVGAEGFARYEKLHQDRTSFVVMPLMLTELATAVLLLRARPDSIPAASVWIGMLLIATIWLSTFFLQVPQHKILTEGFNVEAHRRLVQTNWIRTIAWTARGWLVLWMVSQLV